MNKLHHEYSVLLSVVFFLISTVSCGERENMARLDEADRLLDQYPDSALAIVRSIDTLSLHSPEESGRHSLLLTMALLKTDPSAVSDAIFKPAWKHYGPIDEPSRETMLAHFARAALLEKQDSVAEALMEYEKVLDYSLPDISSRYKCKSYLNIASDLLEMDYPDLAYDYARQAREVIDYPADTVLTLTYHIISGMCLNGMERHDEAENEFSKGLSLVKDSCASDLTLSLISNLAFTNSMQGKYEEAVKLWERLLSRGVSLSYDCLFGYSLSLIAFERYEEALEMILQMRASGRQIDRMRYYFLMSEVKERTGAYQDAMEMRDSLELQRSMDYQDKLESHGESKLIESLRKEISDKRSALESEQQQGKTSSAIIAIVSCICAVIIILIIFLWKKYKASVNESEKRDCESRGRAEFLEKEIIERKESEEQLMKKVKSLLLKLQKLKKDNFELRRQQVVAETMSMENEKFKSKSEELTETQDKYADSISKIDAELLIMRGEIRERFFTYHRSVAHFCNNPPSGVDINLFESDRSKYLQLYRDKKYISELKYQIDFFTNGFLSYVEKKLKLTETLVRTGVYDICGFNYISIGIIENTSATAGGTARNRLKNKLETLGEKDLRRCKDLFNLW